MTYGTGAIMAVPAHDERDFAFARKFGLPIPVVIAPPDWDGKPLEAAYTGDGTMVNSGPFDGTPVPAEMGQVIRWLEQQGTGKGAVTYRLRDWLISRQRYWGAPIPMVYCPEHGQVPVPDDQLPVLLPDDVELMPTGECPLKLHPTWRHDDLPDVRRAGRARDRHDGHLHVLVVVPVPLPQPGRTISGPCDPKEYDYWMPVDCYTGGIEHATMHLLYTRFFTKALRDMGLVPFGEPMLQLRNQGIILGEDSEKMCKSRGNVVAPDELVARYGADALRAYLMFAYRWQEGGPWSSQGIEGTARWLNRVWSLSPSRVPASRPATRRRRGACAAVTHQTIRRISADFESFEFNTIVSALMEMANALHEARPALAGSPAWDEALSTLLLLMAPVTPHVAEELWQRLGKPYSIHRQSWPAFDADAGARRRGHPRGAGQRQGARSTHRAGRDRRSRGAAHGARERGRAQGAGRQGAAPGRRRARETRQHRSLTLRLRKSHRDFRSRLAKGASHADRDR